MGALVFAVVVSTGLAGFSARLQEGDTTYAVTGETPQQITASIGGSGLYDSIDTGAGAATTGGTIGIEYAPQPGPDGCRLSGARVTAFVSETLPSWDAPPRASAAARDWWSKMLSAVKKHEDGHRDRWLAAAQDAAVFLEEQGPERDCASLDRDVRSEREAANTDAMRRQVDWDEKTRHGRQQYEEVFGRR